jgi:hypothetical protein
MDFLRGQPASNSSVTTAPSDVK